MLRLLIAGLLLSLPSATGASLPDWSQRIVDRLSRPAEAKLEGTEAAEAPIVRLYAAPETLQSDDIPGMLERLLPAGSSVRLLDNSGRLAVLTTPSAHAGVHDLLSLISRRAQAPSAEPRVDVLAGELKRLADAQPATVEAVSALRREVQALEATLTPPPEPARLQWEPVALAVCLAAWIWVRRSRRKPPERPAASLALLPVANELSRTLLPETRQQAEDIKLALRELGHHLQRSLEARSTEISGMRAQVLELEQVRSQELAASRAALADATQAIEGTAARLTHENNRVEALASELGETLQQLDQARDRLRATECELTVRERELSRRNGELEHERAKLAALALILERVDGATVSQPPSPPPRDIVSGLGTCGSARPPAPLGFTLLPCNRDPDEPPGDAHPASA